MRENHVEIRGNVGADAKVIITEKNIAMTILSVAISNNYKDRETDEWIKKDPTWVDVLCFKNVAEKASLIQKGERVTVEGKLSVVVNKNEKGENIKNLTLIANDIERTILLKNLNMVTSMEDEVIETLSDEVGF